MSTAARSSNSTRTARFTRRIQASDPESRSRASKSSRRTWRWLTCRLMNREVVTVSRLEDLPMEALAEREYARRSGLSSMLAVPVTIGERPRLGAGGRQLPAGARVARAPCRTGCGSWPASSAARCKRSRQDATLRASMAEIQQLNHRLTADNVCLKEDIKTFHDFDEIVGESAVMRDALDRLAQVAPLNCAVLLLGETGTGKELFARAVHERSRRRARALVRVNCAALPPSLIESELFGHEKGAFTGAVGLRQGRFELADGGTLFLDEIGDLPLEMQGKLLRVLQEGEFERVGSSRTRRVDVRVIAATHHDLEAAVAERAVQGRSLLSTQCLSDQGAGPARTSRGYLLAGVVLHPQSSDGNWSAASPQVPDDVISALERARLAGQRARARKHHRARVDSIDRRHPAARRHVRRAPARPGAGRPGNARRPCSACTSRRRCDSATWRINGIGNAAERLGLHPNTLRFRMKKLGITLRIAPRAVHHWKTDRTRNGRHSLTCPTGALFMLATRRALTVSGPYRRVVAVVPAGCQNRSQHAVTPARPSGKTSGDCPAIAMARTVLEPPAVLEEGL